MDKNIKNSNSLPPLVSVVMSVYNGEKYLKRSIDSILNQSFKNFEFIIINDGSTDTTENILESYADPRIQIITQDNKGLVESLNTGCKLATGFYIARQDADDVSHSERLMRQLDEMKADSNLAIIGTSIEIINSKGYQSHTHSVLVNNADIKQELLIRSPFAHGSIMMRKDIFQQTKGYCKKFWPAEDYKLWLDIGTLGNMKNLPEFLYQYREHDAGISSINNTLQIERANKVRECAWQRRHKLVRARKMNFSFYNVKDRNLYCKDRIINDTIALLKKAARVADFRMSVILLYNLLSSPCTFQYITRTLKNIIMR